MPPTDWYNDWLERLGLDHPPALTLDGLRLVQRAHLQHIPFENLDPLFGTVPSLEIDRIVRKILNNRRGGYCFEINRLLAQGLRSTGFSVSLHLARVMWRRPEPGPETHCLLTVTLANRRYLVDAGFGGPVPLSPILLTIHTGDTPESGEYQLSDGGDLGIILSRRMPNGALQPLYAVTEKEALPGKLDAGNLLAATSPDSPFTQRLVLCRVMENQRIMLENTRLIQRNLAGEELSSELLTPAQTVQQVTGLFGLNLTPPDKSRLHGWLAGQA